MKQRQPRVIGSFPISSPERVWVAIGNLPVARPVDVLGWAVLSDGSLAPIAEVNRMPACALVGNIWERDLTLLAQRWVDALPQLPYMPKGTTVDMVPVAWFDDYTLIVGSVGLGPVVWGPFIVLHDQIVAGIDTLPRLENPRVHPDEFAHFLPGAPTMCRITWDETAVLTDGTLATILVEPSIYPL